MHREALEHENEPNGTVWDCTLIKIMRENKDTVVDEVKDADEAIKIIISCIENYNNCFDENGNKKVDAE